MSSKRTNSAKSAANEDDDGEEEDEMWRVLHDFEKEVPVGGGQTLQTRPTTTTMMMDKSVFVNPRLYG